MIKTPETEVALIQEELKAEAALQEAFSHLAKVLEAQAALKKKFSRLLKEPDNPRIIEDELFEADTKWVEVEAKTRLLEVLKSRLAEDRTTLEALRTQLKQCDEEVMPSSVAEIASSSLTGITASLSLAAGDVTTGPAMSVSPLLSRPPSPPAQSTSSTRAFVPPPASTLSSATTAFAPATPVGAAELAAPAVGTNSATTSALIV